MPDSKTAMQAQMFANRLAKRYKHLSKWARRAGLTAFRLYDRDIPEIPLVLDYYGEEHGEKALAGALYERPYEKDENEEELWLGEMRAAAAAAIDVETGRVFIKRRRRQRGASQYEKYSARGFTLRVSEGGLRFKVNLSDYLDTGLFLDRRRTRSLVGQDAAGKRVLNLFCYTASYSVYAAAAGAAETCSVDISNTYLGWAKENFSMNGLKAQALGAQDFFARHAESRFEKISHRLVRSDVLSFLEQAHKAGCAWDLIILDPPAFSNSKKMNATFDLKRDHVRLIRQCLSLLGENGKLWFSANAKRFNESAGELEAALGPRFPGVKVTDLKNKTVDEDFRGKKMPGSFVIGSGK